MVGSHYLWTPRHSTKRIVPIPTDFKTLEACLYNCKKLQGGCELVYEKRIKTLGPVFSWRNPSSTTLLSQTRPLMAVALKATCFLQLQKKPQDNLLSRPSNPQSITISARTTFKHPMAALSTVGLAETFTRLRKQGKVSIQFSIPHLSLILFPRFASHFLGFGFVAS